MATLFGYEGKDNNMIGVGRSIRIEQVSNGFIVYSGLGVHVFDTLDAALTFLGKQPV